MAGTLVIDTLKASTGVLATQNGMTGIAKAWVNFDGNGTIRTSFNVSSVTAVSTGHYTINLTTAMPITTYTVVGSCSSNYGTAVTFMDIHVNVSDTNFVPTASTFGVATFGWNGVAYSLAYNSVAVFSS